MRAGKDYTKLTGDSFHEVLTLIRFGRFDEVLEVTRRPESDIPGGLWDFAQGYAHLKLGHADFAALYLGRVKKAAETSNATFRFHSAKDLLTIVAGILEGEMQRTAGDLTAAIATFQQAAARQERPRLRRTGTAALLRLPLAGGGAPRGETLRGGRESLSHRAQGPPAQRVVAARRQAGARGDGRLDDGRRRRVDRELVALGHVDQVVTLLSLARPRGSRQFGLDDAHVGGGRHHARHLQARGRQQTSVFGGRYALPRRESPASPCRRACRSAAYCLPAARTRR